MGDYAKDVLVSTDWVEEHKGDDNVAIGAGDHGRHEAGDGEQAHEEAVYAGFWARGRGLFRSPASLTYEAHP